MIKRSIIIAVAMLCIHFQCSAQSEHSPATVTITGDGNQETLEVQQRETTTNEEAPGKEIETQARVKHSLAFEVLGRDLTQREKENYGDDLSKEELKNILAGEQKLAIVRALITLNSEDSVKEVLDIYRVSSVQTYNELVNYFSGLIEKYGSIKAGIESEFVYNIKDNGQAFRKAAFKAYETVFGVPEDKQNKDQILIFLTQNNALTYSKMIQTLMQTITPEAKKQILFSALDTTGRPDLKMNNKFVKKMLEQDFTYENLMKLFKELKNSAPATQEKNLQIQKN